MKTTGLEEFVCSDQLQFTETVFRRFPQVPGFLTNEVAKRPIKIAGALLRSLRVYQWSKNGLLLVHLLFTAASARSDLLVDCLIGVLAFSLTASAGYVVNDLQDRQRDRLCERRRFRPFASGELTTRDGGWAITLLLVASFTLSLVFLPPAFSVSLGVYLCGSVVYSLVLKHRFLLDIAWLAGLYVLRIVAGACAVQIVPPLWLLSFVACYFLQLAIVKRCADLVSRIGSPASAAILPYQQSDLRLLVVLGGLSGVASTIVLALYVLLPATTAGYQRPWLLWIVVALVILWTLRIWRQALNGQIRSDPVWASLKDPASFFCASAVVECILLAM